MLAAYGENDLAIRNIQLGSGTIKVHGSGVPAGHDVWVAGRQVPVDAQGNFVAEEILPSGAHTVEVAMLDEAGNGTLYLRDLELKRNDWFYVGLADLTLSENRTNGPAELLQGANAPQDLDSSLDGRLAFYVNGKFGEHWRLTASADTREGPVEDLFSNFLDKSPDSLFRRIDPDYHYPTFGDDGVVEEMAPTMGKFYVKLSEGENHGLWGNFKVGYMENELAQVDRGLYGANAHYESETTTSFGEQRYGIDGFAAEPGTVASYEEFRGTGGSLYFLRRQDILPGSETRAHRAARQGLAHRHGRREPASGARLRHRLPAGPRAAVRAAVLDRRRQPAGAQRRRQRRRGVPGRALRVHARLRRDRRRGRRRAGPLLVQRPRQARPDRQRQRRGRRGQRACSAADVTLRMSAESWFKLQAGRSEGLVSNAMRSDDGGFGFYGYDDLGFTDASADAYRADLSVGARRLLRERPGSRDALYADAGRGLLGARARDAHGHRALRRHLRDAGDGPARASRPRATSGSRSRGSRPRAQEIDVGFQVTNAWSVSTGLRNDLREDHSPVVPADPGAGRAHGRRRAGRLRLGRRPGGSTASCRTRCRRPATARTTAAIGTGGSYRFTDRFRLDAEVSDGDLGPGGRVGTNYLLTERTNLYLNYALENERADNGLYAPRATWCRA